MGSLGICVVCIWTVSRYKTKPLSDASIGGKLKKLRVDPKNCELGEGRWSRHLVLTLF
ncbi:MAG: hypothetical protein DNFNHJIP_00117 [Candidatus Argoarchaeum ethanivorans]|uniref:Uncharacterized protein n=1 Tax=Candidatus Argoarchaeum ethanivorans TaxID=2608793 RepID=A0A812A196_9EURY|nr:MAG: hypothetical protein DNFNHJIP_00117 [Candidatus Argoarchaeum ethanivorans]